jgi:hypothetical protein
MFGGVKDSLNTIKSEQSDKSGALAGIEVSMRQDSGKEVQDIICVVTLIDSSRIAQSRNSAISMPYYRFRRNRTRNNNRGNFFKGQQLEICKKTNDKLEFTRP